jgi:hypothetical protein
VALVVIPQEVFIARFVQRLSGQPRSDDRREHGTGAGVVAWSVLPAAP